MCKEPKCDPENLGPYIDFRHQNPNNIRPVLRPNRDESNHTGKKKPRVPTDGK